MKTLHDFEKAPIRKTYRRKSHEKNFQEEYERNLGEVWCRAGTGFCSRNGGLEAVVTNGEWEELLPTVSTWEALETALWLYAPDTFNNIDRPVDAWGRSGKLPSKFLERVRRSLSRIGATSK